MVKVPVQVRLSAPVDITASEVPLKFRAEEYRIGNAGVAGSIPVSGSSFAEMGE